MIANSEYCSETLSTLKWEYSMNDFLELSTLISYYNDLKTAAELDQKVMDDRNRTLQQMSSNM